MQVVFKLLLIVIVCTGVAVSQPPEPLENHLFEQVYLAKDDGSGNPGEAMTEFTVSDIPIHCVVVLTSAGSVTVKMDLVVVAVTGVKPETKVVSTSYTTKDLQDRVFFHGKPRGLWVPGTYRADIYIDGTLVGKFPFNIKGSAKPAMNFQPRLPVQPIKARSATAKKT